MSFLSRIKENFAKKKGPATPPTPPAPPTQSPPDRLEMKPGPQPGKKPGAKKSATVLVSLIALVLGGGLGLVAGSLSPNSVRELLQEERLVPESELDLVRAQKKAPERPVARQRARDSGARIQPEGDEGQIKRRPIQQQPKLAEKSPVRQRPESKEKPIRNEPKESDAFTYIDDVGQKTNPGRDIVRSSDLPEKRYVPRAVENSDTEFNFSEVTLSKDKIDRLLAMRDDGIQFFLRMDCDYCREAYSLAVNLHLRYPDMPIGLTFLIADNKEVLLYGAWQLIRLINEEEGWNLLNFAFNSKDMPDSDKVLQAYEALNPKFRYNALIDFWKNRMPEFSSLLDMPYELRKSRGWDAYKVPFITVHGKIQEKANCTLEGLRSAYLAKVSLGR